VPRVLITGASRGLGFELARQYAADGWDVFATVRAQTAVEKLRALGGNIHTHLLDVSDFGAIDALAGELSGVAIDQLILNAGINPQSDRDPPVDGVDYDAWPEAFRVNTIGALRTAAAFAPHVEASQKKIVAAVSSGGASLSQPRGTNYVYRSSKAALNFCMAALAREWKGRGITVVLLAPGHTRTDMGGPHAPLMPEDTVRKMRQVLANVTFRDSGRFIANDGSDNPW
jgi:NAD(P)-dependent dehydrogenase (short-subunit alcohol dehydrogenase family)